MEDLAAADKCKTRMNLAAIKKVDPYAKDIVDTSSHVAFYIFNSEQNEWEKTDVEGAFFVYSRNAQPFHSIFIINRLNTTSFVEPITSHLELQAQAPFLLYRNERSRIRGFWFYNGEECERISKLVIDLVQESSKSLAYDCFANSNNNNNNNNNDGSHESSTAVSTAASTATTSIQNEKLENNTNIICNNSSNVNIFKMLSHAQQEFNNIQTNQANSPSATARNTIPSTPTNQPTLLQQLRPDADTATITPQQKPNHSPQTMHTPTDQCTPSGNVMKFFAAAKNSAEVTYTPRILPLEQIEKQQRDIAPLTQKSDKHLLNDNFALLPPTAMQYQQESPAAKHQQKHQIFHSLDLTQSDNAMMNSTAKLSCAQLERNGDNSNSLLLYHHPRSSGPAVNNHCVNTTSPDLKPLLSKKMPDYDYRKTLVNTNSNSICSPDNNIPGEQISLSKIFSNLNVSQAVDTVNILNDVPSKPALMPPTMFDKPTNSTPAVSESLPRHLNAAPTVTSKLLEPLSKYQLIQAFNYLIQNDDEFVEKLHDAYLKTITKFGTYQ